MRYRCRWNNTLTLGIKGEVVPYDYTDMGWEAELLMEKLHNILYDSLMERELHLVYMWTGRVQNVFNRNHVSKVGQIVNMTESKVFTLHGCGLVVRKEVYGVFQDVVGITLPAWEPRRWYQKYRTYDFGDEI